MYLMLSNLSFSMIKVITDIVSKADFQYGYGLTVTGGAQAL